MSEPAFSQILLKLSGEVLANKLGFGIDPKKVLYLAEEIKPVYDAGLKIGLIIGAGNIFRGLEASAGGMDRVTGDYLGMLATIMNAIALQDALENLGVPTRVQTSIEMRQIAEPYIRRKAIRHLEKGRVVIFGGGTGNPYFSTDTAAALRASELNCSIIIKATKVDGIYDEDPVKNPKAKFYKKISYSEVLNKDLKVMDITAISLAKESKIPILITNINKKNSIINAINSIGKFSKIS